MKIDPLWERQAMEVIDTFASFGVDRFLLIYTNAQNEKVAARKNCTVELLRKNIGATLAKAEESMFSVVIKPYSNSIPLFQLDDLQAKIMQRVRPAAFLILETSPDNYHAWFAVPDGDLNFWRKVKKATGSDKCSAGASRLSGCLNTKAKYAPNFPRVKTLSLTPGLIVNQADLDTLGFVACADKSTKPQLGGVCLPDCRRRRRPLDYERWANHPNAPHIDGKLDRSRVDFTWCQTCIERGYSVVETATMLMEVSEKAKAEGFRYAHLTAENAAGSLGGTPPPDGA